MKWYADWIRYQIEDLNIDVRKNTEPGVDDLRGYDLVVNATGASSYAPQVHGKQGAVIPFEEVMACPKTACEFHPKDGRKPRKLEGPKVVVWGDHYPAVDTVLNLARMGKEVTVVTNNREFAAGVEVIHMYVFRKRFALTDAEALESKPFQHPVTVIENSRIDEIRDGEIDIIDNAFTKTTIPCDHVVTCWVKPNTSFLEKLQAEGLPVVNAGDSVRPRNLHAAVDEGAGIGLSVDEHSFINPNLHVADGLPIDTSEQLKKKKNNRIQPEKIQKEIDYK